MEVEYLDLEDDLRLVELAGIGPVRDLGLLDSAMARPRSSVFGRDAYPTLPLKAAVPLQSLVGNRALVDGNERLGWLATVTFLGINGYEVDLGDDDASQLVWDLAAGLEDLEEIVARLVLAPTLGPEA